ncbi:MULTISPECIES: glycosyltransferase family 2 protein [Aphanothece]|uniref:glycosyltransferase family 2 protein n=1 Tax=Aphanothece TaxID=1121 RepID=UPI00398496AA
MTPSPEISVVMGVHNGAAHLEATLRSILDQQGADLEFVVVDDGSTDGTAAILAFHAQADARLRVITQPNQGLTRALIRGCHEARGAFIARQDAGDVSEPGRLREQLALMRRYPQAVFCSCWARMVAKGGELLYEARGSGLSTEPRWVLEPAARHGILDGPSVHPTVMMRRAAYEQAGGYRAALRVGQDWDLWYRLAALGAFVMLPQPLYTYRFDEGGISATRAEEQAAYARLSLQAMRLRARGESDEPVLQQAAAMPPTQRQVTASRARARMNYFVASNLIRNRDSRALRYIWASLRDDPLAPRVWMRGLQAAFLKLRSQGAASGSVV